MAIADLSVEQELVAHFASFLEGREQSPGGRRTSNESDGVQLIKKFMVACDSRLHDLRQTIGVLDNPIIGSEYKYLEQERNTWSLLADLLGTREQKQSGGLLVDDGVDAATMGDRAIVSHYQSANPEINESVVVKEWLERIAGYQSVELVDTETTRYLEATSRKLGTDLCQELDPDGPIRTSRPLDAEDSRIKGRLVRNLYELVRRGEMGKALDLCRACNEHWRAASLAGGIYYHDPKTGYSSINGDDEDNDALQCPEGNRNRGLWMMTCFQIANETSFDPYERALYASLCGNTVLQVCKTWEDMLWAHFNSLVINETEKHLGKYPRIRDDEYEEFTVPTVERLTVQQIFDRLLNCSNPEITAECGSLFRQTQMAMILNRFDELMFEFHQAVYRENDYDPRYLRLFAHIILVMKSMDLPVDEEIGNAILGLYVDWLTDCERNELAMLYASRLPYDLQVQRCAQLLQRLRMPMKQREPILKLAHGYGLDVKAITRSVAETTITLQETRSYPAASVVAFDLPLEDQDQYQIDMFLWLLFERDLSLQAILHCNAIYRRMLSKPPNENHLTHPSAVNQSPLIVAGKLNAAYKLYRTLLTESPYFGSVEFVQMVRKNFGGEQKVENFIHELTGHGLFLDAMHKYHEWKALWSRHMDKGDMKFLSAQTDLKQMALAVEQAFQNCLQPSKYLTWLQDDEEYRSDMDDQSNSVAGGDAMAGSPVPIFSSQTRLEEMAMLRQVFIPQLVFCLHDLLFETRQLIESNLWKSLDLATLVASEDRRLYLEFLPPLDDEGVSRYGGMDDPRRVNRCQELLMRIRQSQLEQYERRQTAA